MREGYLALLMRSEGASRSSPKEEMKACRSISRWSFLSAKMSKITLAIASTKETTILIKLWVKTALSASLELTKRIQ